MLAIIFFNKTSLSLNFSFSELRFLSISLFLGSQIFSSGAGGHPHHKKIYSSPTGFNGASEKKFLKKERPQVQTPEAELAQVSDYINTKRHQSLRDCEAGEGQNQENSPKTGKQIGQGEELVQKTQEKKVKSQNTLVKLNRMTLNSETYPRESDGI